MQGRVHNTLTGSTVAVTVLLVNRTGYDFKGDRRTISIHGEEQVHPVIGVGVGDGGELRRAAKLVEAV
jgi:hypothetical protein